MTLTLKNGYSGPIRGESIDEIHSHHLSRNRTGTGKKRRELKNVLEDLKNQFSKSSHKSRIQSLERRSKEKALVTFKRSIETSRNEGDTKIDDSKFKELVKEKHKRLKKNINEVMSQANKMLERAEKDR
jgi:hypothetical protein